MSFQLVQQMGCRYIKCGATVVRFDCGAVWLWCGLTVVRCDCGAVWLCCGVTVVQCDCGAVRLWCGLTVVRCDCGVVWLWCGVTVWLTDDHVLAVHQSSLHKFPWYTVWRVCNTVIITYTDTGITLIYQRYLVCLLAYLSHGILLSCSIMLDCSQQGWGNAEKNM